MSVRLIPFSLKTSEHFGQGARLVGGGEHDGGLVVAAAAGGLAANHEKTRLVVRVVLDVLEQHVQTVQLAGQRRSDGGNPGLGGGHLGGLARARRRLYVPVPRRRRQPLPALAEHLGLRIDRPHLLPRALGHRLWWMVIFTSAHIWKDIAEKGTVPARTGCIERILSKCKQLAGSGQGHSAMTCWIARVCGVHTLKPYWPVFNFRRRSRSLSTLSNVTQMTG